MFKRRWSVRGMACGVLMAALLGAADAPSLSEETVQARSPVEAGRYIVSIGGCNDCHTPGWLQRPGTIPEELWLTGVPIGWRGPWGTTYGSNLRIFAKDFDENTWVQVLRARNSRPPMAWESLHSMSDQDLKALFAYIRSLPVTGEKMPAAVPPGVEPGTPYFSLEPVMPKSAATTQPASAEHP